MKILVAGLLVCAAAVSAGATVYHGAIQYGGMDGAPVRTISYSLETDGTLGWIGQANFVGFTVNADVGGTLWNTSDNDASSSLTTLDSLHGGDNVPIFATSTTLSFQYDNPFNSYLKIDSTYLNGTAELCFTTISCSDDDLNAGPKFLAQILDRPDGLITGYSRGYGYLPSLTVIANATPTPEPAAWALMVLGFGAVGASMRRRSVSVSYA